MMIRIGVKQPVERNDIMFNHVHLQTSGESTANLAMVISVLQYLSPMDIYRLSTCDTCSGEATITFSQVMALEDSWIYASIGSGK